jgi:hypothetical protein
MKPLLKTRTTIPSLIIVFTFCCLTPSPIAQAVSPAPDGGYPGGNTAEGQNALLSRTTGQYNTAVGFFSLTGDTTGSFNTALGAGALVANTASGNTATGTGALLSNTTGAANTATGEFALSSNTTGNDNTATGSGALMSNTTGLSNTASGAGALASNTTGNNNTAMGQEALLRNDGGSENTAIGTFALHNNSGPAGTANTAIGYLALDGNTGTGNTALGDRALTNNTTGGSNVAIGDGAGFNATTGSLNVYIGAGMEGFLGESNACYIASIFGGTSTDGTSVFVNSSGKLGTVTSSRRFKENIKPMEHASEAIFALQPVSFRYKKDIDHAGRSQFGLVAEEVEKVNPDLVVRDKEGKPYSVRYDQVNAMLLNEFLKEHTKVEQLEKEIHVIMAHFKQQDLEIQKVRIRMEMSRSETQLSVTDD